MREEIAAGIKNAMDRGVEIERAAQSFINSGYNPQEVRAAMQTISQGASKIVSPEEKEEKEKQDAREEQNEEIKKEKGKRILLVGSIVLVAIFLIVAVIFLIYSLN